MATLALSAAVKGAGLGGWQLFLANVGAMMVGGYVDSTMVMPAIFPTDPSEGPRLRDLQLQTAKEGSAANRCYGEGDRIAGTLIWQPRLREVRTNQSGGGKGGAGGEHLEYKYFAHAAVEIARTDGTPYEGIDRVYANGKLLWQSADDLSYSSTKISAKAIPWWKPWWNGGDQSFLLRWYLELRSDHDVGGPDLALIKSGKTVGVSGFVDTEHPLQGQLTTQAIAFTGDTEVEISSAIAGTLFAGDRLTIVGTTGTYVVAQDYTFTASEQKTVELIYALEDSVSSSAAATPASDEDDNNDTDWICSSSGFDDLTNESWVRLRRDTDGGPFGGTAGPQPFGKAVGDTVVITQEEATHSAQLGAIRFYMGSDDQLPDPLIVEYEEPNVGTGNVPGFRRCVYAVIEDLELTDYGNVFPNLEFVPRVSTDVTLQSAVEQMLLDWGFAAHEFDVSALSGNLDGFHITGPQKLGEAWQPVVIAKQLVVRDEEGVLTVEHRADLTPIAIATTDMAAGVGGTTVPKPMRLHDQSEFRAIDSLWLEYRDPDRQYKTGSKRCRGHEGMSREEETIQLPIAMDGDEAQQLVNTLWAIAQVRRQEATFTVSPLLLETMKAAHPYSLSSIFGQDWEVMADRVELGQNMVMQVHGHIEDSEVFVQDMEGEGSTESAASGGSEDSHIRANSPAGQVLLQVMDLPALGESHVDVPGVYIAAVGEDQRMPWHGAELYESFSATDGFRNVALIQEEAVIGEVTVPLSTSVDSGWWDRVSQVEFRTINKGITLASVTPAEALRGRNLFLIGGELVAIVDLELVSTDYMGRRTWRGSQILRGLRDTDDAMVRHNLLDRVVWLDGPGIMWVEKTGAAIGETRYYRAVPAGGLLADAPTEQNQMLGRTVLPPRVVSVAGTRDGSDNLTVTWERQTRRILQVLDQAVSLDEDSESYQVEAMDGSDVVRREVVTSRTWTYTAAEQTTDGLTPGDDVDVVIRQGSKFGQWGREREATV